MEPSKEPLTKMTYLGRLIQRNTTKIQCHSTVCHMYLVFFQQLNALLNLTVRHQAHHLPLVSVQLCDDTSDVERIGLLIGEAGLRLWARSGYRQGFTVVQSLRPLDHFLCNT